MSIPKIIDFAYRFFEKASKRQQKKARNRLFLTAGGGPLFIIVTLQTHANAHAHAHHSVGQKLKMMIFRVEKSSFLVLPHAMVGVRTP